MAKKAATQRVTKTTTRKKATPKKANQFTAWVIDPSVHMPIEPAPHQRDWMDETHLRFAYRCLPLVIANQSGWIIRSAIRFTVRWNGGLNLLDLKLKFPKDTKQGYVGSHFGSGVVTFSLPYIFQTPPGVNLWVKGPTNWIKDGIQPLEGIIETDWLESTFTMNWKVTRPNRSITFEKGEPICMLVPIPRGFVESQQPVRKPLTENPALHTAFNKWGEGRKAFNEGLAKNDPEISEKGWQRDYMLGRNVAGEIFPDHQTRLPIRPFVTEGL